MKNAQIKIREITNGFIVALTPTDATGQMIRDRVSGGWKQVEVFCKDEKEAGEAIMKLFKSKPTKN